MVTEPEALASLGLVLPHVSNSLDAFDWEEQQIPLVGILVIVGRIPWVEIDVDILDVLDRPIVDVKRRGRLRERNLVLGQKLLELSFVGHRLMILAL